MKRIFSFLTAVISLFSFNAITLADFTDVNPDHPYFESIQALERAGILEGYSDGSYRPDALINRAEALKIILMGSSIEIPNDVSVNPFPDVTSDTWYAPLVSQAKLLEIVQGDDNTGLFRPGDNIKLAEILKILLETNQRNVVMPDNGPYADVPKDAWFAGYFEYAKKIKLFPQSSYDNVNPGQLVTRGMMADLMQQLREKPEGYEEGVASFYGLAVQGNGTASGERFDAYALTAAHPSLPFGTMVQVTNLDNGKQVIVRINDRGPYGEGRIIDLSRSAFEQISSLSSGLARVSIVPLGDSPTPELPNNPCEAQNEIDFLDRNAFESLTLDTRLPNRFLADEVWPISGLSQSEDPMVTAFVMNEAGRQFPFYAEVDENGRFELDLSFPQAGHYQFGILPGTSGETTVEDILVLDTNCQMTSVDANQAPLNEFTVNLKDGNTILKWSDLNNYELYKLRFTQSGREKVYLIYGEREFIPHYADFEGWSSGMVHVEIQGAKVNTESLLQMDQLLWSPALENDFMALMHQPYRVNEKEANITELPTRLKVGQPLTIRIDPTVNVAYEGLIINPQGLVEKLPLKSPTHNPILNDNGVKILPHTTTEVSMTYTPQEDAVYFMEINNENGLAIINVPIYPEGTYPLLPNPVDSAGLNQTELEISLPLIQLQMLNLLNADRMAAGLNSVRMDENLNQLAQMKVEDMAERDYFSHWNPDGKTVNDLRKEFAIAQIISENIARDSSPQLAQFGLMSSASHRLNIMDPEWTRAGFGFVKDPNHGGYLFVQIFSEDPVDLSNVEELREKTVAYINEKRNFPLGQDETLSEEAQIWSEWMVEKDFFDVDGSGKNFIDNVRSKGYKQALGTLLLGDTRFEDLLDGIQDNPQLLESRWTSLGVGLAQDDNGLIKLTLVYVE